MSWSDSLIRISTYEVDELQKKVRSCFLPFWVLVSGVSCTRELKVERWVWALLSSFACPGF